MSNTKGNCGKQKKINQLENLENLVENHTKTERHLEQYSHIGNRDNIENSRYKSTTNIITACGETHTGRQWSEILHVGVNRINRIIRKKGKEAVIVFIEENYKKDSVQD